MGHAGVETAVADAGPLIHLSEVECLPLLKVFEILHIPDAIWVETVEQRSIEVPKAGHICRHSLESPEVIRFSQEHRLEKLQAGEKECLYLCQHLGISTLLTDDLSVREVAKSLKLTPVGSLGVVIRAYKRDFLSLSQAESHLIQLYETSSLFVTRTIIEVAIEQLHLAAD